MNYGIKWMREVGNLDLKLREKDWLWYEKGSDNDVSNWIANFQIPELVQIKGI